MATSTRNSVESGGATHIAARASRRVRTTGRRDASTKRLTILHVHGRMGRGGAEMRTVEMFRNIDRQKYRFHFCAMSGLPGELDDEIRSLGGIVHRMAQEPVGFSRRLRQLIRRHEYDVVHSHLHFYSGYPLKLAAQCGVPVRVAHFRTTRDDVVTTPSRRAARILLSRLVHRYATGRMTRRWIDEYATDILGVSRWVLESTWGSQWTDDPRCRVVYDALDPGSFEGASDRRAVCREFGLAESSPLLVHVGRMAEPKNHVRLVSIFAEVVRREPAARLLLIGRTDAYRGDHAIERRVRARMAELGIGDRVVFAGERTDVPRLLKAADLLIFPSLWEGLGDVVLEARAAGTPVLACDLPCVQEIADRLPGVRCLSLDESDAKWADWAVRLTGRRPSDLERRTALEFFRHSEFTVGRCLDTLCRLWDGTASGDASGGVADG
ncbi:MAG: glycosyltransferase [Thermoguttaceae bacterium]